MRLILIIPEVCPRQFCVGGVECILGKGVRVVYNLISVAMVNRASEKERKLNCLQIAIAQSKQALVGMGGVPFCLVSVGKI